MHPALTDVHKIDVIGDIHGCYQPLTKLLQRLGYWQDNGVFQHPERKAIFVGDLIDRGPMIRETLELVYRMHQQGSAFMVLGNHEYNAIRYQDEIEQLIRGDVDAAVPARLSQLMKDTILQFMNRPQEWRKYTRWLSQLPLFIEGPGYRVVHACWDHQLINSYRQHYPEQGITDEFIEASRQKGSTESKTVDRLTRGTSMPLPDGMQLESKDGFIRRVFRTKFWADSPETYGDIVFQPDPLPYEVAENKIQPHHRGKLLHYQPHEPPIFFGHYWLKGRPQPLQNNIACLDYSAVSFGRLTAYTYQGEQVLQPENFTWVYVDP